MKRCLNFAAILVASALLFVACGATPAMSSTAAVSSATPAAKPVTAAPAAKPTPTQLAAKTAAALPTATRPASTGPYDLTILHTNDVKGYLEPCG